MKFTLALDALMADRFRLQNDGSWRTIKDLNEPILETDKVFAKLSDIPDCDKRNIEIDVNGSKLLVNSNSWSLGQIHYSLEPIVHRDEKPPLFTVDDVRATIASGNDSQNNSLVVTIDGKPDMVKFSSKLVTGHDYAVRNETFGAGGGYVGLRASQDESFVRNQYRDSLSAWITHLSTGKLGIYTDGSDGRDISVLINEYNQLQVR